MREVTVLDNLEILDAAPKIAVIRIVNPFDPRDRVIESLSWVPGKTLADYFPLGCVNVIVSVNGRIVEQDQFGVTYLAPEDNLVVCPVPEGGGGDNKGIIAMVAMIAVAVVAPYAAAGLYSAMGGTFVAANAGLVLSAMTVGITMAGSMLVNALLAPSQPTSSASGSSSGGQSVTTYGIDGAKNTSVEGVSIPVLYGEFRMGGNIINLHVENDGDAQLVYMRLVVSEGEIAQISDIQLNDQSIGNYAGIESDVRLGAGSQSVMGWFGDTISPTNLGLELTTAWVYHTTGSIDKYRIDFSAPGGLFGINTENGSIYRAKVNFEVEYRLAGSGAAWQSMPSTTDHYSNRPAVLSGGTWYWAGAIGGPEPSLYGSPIQGVITDPWTLSYLNSHTVSYYSQSIWNMGGEGYDWGQYQMVEVLGGMVPMYETSLKMEDAKRGAVRKSFTSQQLPRAAYEVRVRRTVPKSTDSTVSDVVYVVDINDILLEDLSFPHTAMLGMKIKMSEQLSGLPKVTFLARGKLIMVNRVGPAGRAWFYEYNANPAWIVWDILTNARYGGGMSSSRLDLPAFQSFADHCQSLGLSWNGPIDREMNVWDACQLVLRVGRAQLIGIGTRFTVVVERAATPVMMFSVANMIEGTFKESWLPVADRANEIEVTYFDKLDNYKQRTVKVYDPAALAAGRPSRNSAITLYGVVDHARAFKEGLFQLNLNRYILQTVEFGAPMEAIGCSVGDLIYVQHDMPQWGFAGRFEAGSTTSVAQLDRDVTMVSGKQYKALVMYDALLRASGTVSSVVGTSIFLAGYNGLMNVRRLKVGALDREVASIFDQGAGSYGVVLLDATGIIAGATYELWDTDVLEERDVVNSFSTGSVLTLQSPLTQAPSQFMHWMFGEVGKYKKPFRVKAINGSHDYRRDITAIEYNESVYDLSGTPVPTMNYSSLSGQVQQVTIDGVEESLFPIGNTFGTHVTVHFHSDQETFSRAAVYAAVNGAGYTLLNRAAFDRATIDLADGDAVTFKVVAFDVMGTSAKDNTAPTIYHMTAGKSAPPQNINASYALELSGVRFAWPKVTDLDLDYYEIRIGGTTWENAVFLTTLLDESYLWKIQPAGTKIVRIAARDTGGRYSAVPTSMAVVITGPSAPPAIGYVINGGDMVMNWSIPLSGFGVDRYEVRYGASWAAGTTATTTKATTYQTRLDYAGARQWWVAAIDTADNVGTPASIAVTVNGPGIVTSARSEVVDNNALLYWVAPAISTGQLPIDRYEVRKGASWALGAVIGSNGNSTFTTVFEQASGTYTYWVSPVDTANNYGTPVGIVATVSQPPDYVLRNNYDSPMTGTPNANVTRTVTNLYADAGSYYGPVNTAHTWGTHFSSGGWASPAAQVAAGNPIYANPSLASGSYEEIIDYAAVTPSTIVTATLNSQLLSGAVTVTCTISWKLAIGDSWVACPAGNTALLPSFRYVKVHYEFTCTAGANLIKVNGLNVKLAIKQRGDSGAGVSVVGGAAVTFNYTSFVSADTPVVQPNGLDAFGKPYAAAVIYAGSANPTGFSVRIFNSAGTEVAGVTFSWNVRGY